MKLDEVALLAQPGCTRLQQGLVIGTVRHMAVGTVLANRRVFPQERPAFFRVAVVTRIVHGGGCQQCGAGAAMGFMTVGTDLQTFPDRVRGAAQKIGPLRAMAVQAQIGLGGALSNRVARIVELVAIAARHFLELVNTARPVRTYIATVAIEADGIFCFGILTRIEGHGGRRAAAISADR